MSARTAIEFSDDGATHRAPARPPRAVSVSPGTTRVVFVTAPDVCLRTEALSELSQRVAARSGVLIDG